MDSRKEALLDGLADFLLAEGLEAASLRPMARAVGTSDRMLIYHFGDKDSLIAAALERIAARLVAQLSALSAPHPVPADALRPRLMDLAQADGTWPFLRLWLQIAARAAQGDALYAGVGNAIGRGFLDWIAAQIDAPDDTARRSEAARLLVVIEGLVLLKALDLDGVCRPALDQGP